LSGSNPLLIKAYFKVVKRIDLMHFYQKKCEVTDVFINLDVVIISQSIHVSNYHMEHIRHIKLICQLYLNMKKLSKINTRNRRELPNLMKSTYKEALYLMVKQ